MKNIYRPDYLPFGRKTRAKQLSQIVWNRKLRVESFYSCSYEIRTPFHWGSQSQNQSNHKGRSEERLKIPLIANELKVKTAKSPKTRENAGDQVVIGFSFASDWLRDWRESSGPMTERNKTKHGLFRISFDTHFKKVISVKGIFFVEQSSGKDRRCLTMFFVFVFPKLIEKYISTFFSLFGTFSFLLFLFHQYHLCKLYYIFFIFLGNAYL